MIRDLLFFLTHPRYWQSFNGNYCKKWDYFIRGAMRAKVKPTPAGDWFHFFNGQTIWTKEDDLKSYGTPKDIFIDPDYVYIRVGHNPDHMPRASRRTIHRLKKYIKKAGKY
jgi:hypothetical protein